jgi:protein disulfide-isomerase
MKSLYILLPLFFVSAMAISQTAYKAEQEGWLVNLEEAYEQSQKTGKPIMANFTGSDWCGWCKKLSASVFTKPEFKKWAAENVVLLELDFPRRKTVPAEIKTQNADLQRAFNVRGFPTVWVFHLSKNNSEFSINALGSTGYKGTVPEFTNDVDQMIARAKS